MDRYPKRIFVRVSEQEHAQAMQLASSLGLTCSELVRVFIKLPKGYVAENGKNTVVVVDTESVCRLARRTRHWGHQYNQLVKGINTIAYCLRNDNYNGSTALEELKKVVERLDGLDAGMELLVKESQRINDFWLSAV